MDEKEIKWESFTRIIVWDSDKSLCTPSSLVWIYSFDVPELTQTIKDIYWLLIDGKQWCTMYKVCEKECSKFNIWIMSWKSLNFFEEGHCHQ